MIAPIAYFGFYAFLRVDHFFVHYCAQSSGQRSYSSVDLADVPLSLFEDWQITIILSIYNLYIPLLRLETFLHLHSLLPSSCPWK